MLHRLRARILWINDAALVHQKSANETLCCYMEAFYLSLKLLPINT